MLLVDGGKATDVFELIELGPALVTVRSAFLFEIGEELKLRIEGDGEPREVTARVRSHLGTGASELEILA